MARPKAENPRNRELLLRLTEQQMEVLESIAHLERQKSPNAYAYELLSEHLRLLEHDPHVVSDLTNRRSYAERPVAKTTAIKSSKAARSATARSPRDQSA